MTINRKPLAIYKERNELKLIAEIFYPMKKTIISEFRVVFDGRVRSEIFGADGQLSGLIEHKRNSLERK